MIRREKNGVVWFEFENLAEHNIRHCFTTRIGGVSNDGYSSLNLGFYNGDDINNIHENFLRTCNTIGFDPTRVVLSNQMHGTHIEKIQEKRDVEKTDGLVTDVVGITLATYYADCVPILLYDPINRAVANAHAGWRGVAADMPSEAVKAMTKFYKTNPNDLLAGIAPSISAKYFEVGADVAEIFKKSLPFSSNFVYNSASVQNKFHIDLWGVCRESLINAGLAPQNIEIANLCTYERDDLFFSHRRSQGAPRGNMLAMIQL
ncbi:MAG: peptidoglycan editing factor PgeF [Defluviitaleaceae bacterium]|nr:peptidoglycan editing factor PgeF [Defluviitaleaceae bacterium]